MIPEGWIEYRIKDIGEVITGKTPSINNPEQFGNMIPFVTPTDFKNYNKNIYHSERGISDEGIKAFANKVLPINSVLVSCIGSDMGKVVMNKASCLTNQQINSIIVDDKKATPDFVYYMLISKYKLLKGMATGGSTMPIVNKGDFENIELYFPKTISEQSRIASILSSLDDKIELNLQMNKTLEAFAQAIFKQWFVDFRFPGFDGELVDGLPKGWRKVLLGELCKKITKGTTPTTLKMEYVSEGINFIKVESIGASGNFLADKFAFIDHQTNQLLKRSIIEENDILFTIAGTLGRVAKVDKSVLPANTNQAVAIIRLDKTQYINFIYLLLKSKLFKNQIESKAVHAVQANLSLGVISDSEIAIPDSKTLNDFDLISSSILNKIVANNNEISTLTAIRDSLLLKLMTGKIKV